MFFKKKIVRDTAMLTAMQLLLDSASLLLNVFITRRLGASAIGIFSLMGSFLGLAAVISNGNAFLCTSRLISEELGRRNGNPNRVLLHGITLCLLLSAGVSAVLLVFSEPVCSRFFSGADVTAAVKLMPAALVTGAVAACLKGNFNAVRKAAVTAVGDIVEFAVRAAVIVGMTLAAAPGDEAAVCRIMIVSIIAGNIFSLGYLLLMLVRLHTSYSGQGTLRFRDYAGFAFPIMGGGILTSVLSSANDALVPVCLRQFGDSAERAFSLFGIFEAIVIPTLFFPSVVLCSMAGIIVSESARASAAGNRQRIQSLTSRLIRYTLIYAVFAAAVLVRFGRPLGGLLGGGELAGRMISAIAPVVPFIYLEIVLEALIKGMGLQAFSSLNYLAEYVIRIAAVLILVPRLGFAGIAVSYYASNIFGNTSRMIKILSHTGVALRPLRSIAAPVVYAFLTMGAVELLLRPVIPEQSTALSMTVFTLLWLSAYGGVFLLMHRLRTKEREQDSLFVQNQQMMTQNMI